MQVLKQEKKERIINSAKQMLLKRDIDYISIKEIAQSASISTGNFYRYFENKEDLFMEIVKQADESIVQFIKDKNNEMDLIVDFKEYIEIAIKEFAKIYYIYKDEIYIMLERGKSQKNSKSKQKIYDLVAEILLKHDRFEKQNIKEDLFYNILSESVVDGVVKIIYSNPDYKEAIRYIEHFIKYIFMP